MLELLHAASLAWADFVGPGERDYVWYNVGERRMCLSGDHSRLTGTFKENLPAGGLQSSASRSDKDEFLIEGGAPRGFHRTLRTGLSGASEARDVRVLVRELSFRRWTGRLSGGH